MNVRLLRIDAPATPPDSRTRFDVRLLLEIDGVQGWHVLQARAHALGDIDATLLEASEALDDTFQHEQITLHRLCKLVGDALRGREVRVPLQIAA